jgi:hypothetical protein
MKYVSPDQTKPVYSAEYDLIIQKIDNPMCTIRDINKVNETNDW